MTKHNVIEYLNNKHPELILEIKKDDIDMFAKLLKINMKNKKEYHTQYVYVKDSTLYFTDTYRAFYLELNKRGECKGVRNVYSAKEIAELLDKATSIGIDVEGNMLFQKGQDLYIIDSLKDVQLIELIKYKDIEADSRVFILDFENTIRWKMATCDTTLKEGIFRQVKDDLYVVVDADSISIPIRVGSFTKGELTKDRTYNHKWLHQILSVFKRNMVLNFGKTIYEPLVIDHKNWTVAMMGYRG